MHLDLLFTFISTHALFVECSACQIMPNSNEGRLDMAHALGATQYNKRKAAKIFQMEHTGRTWSPAMIFCQYEMLKEFGTFSKNRHTTSALSDKVWINIWHSLWHTLYPASTRLAVWSCTVDSVEGSKTGLPPPPWGPPYLHCNGCKGTSGGTNWQWLGGYGTEMVTSSLTSN